MEWLFFRGTNLTDTTSASDCGSYESLDYFSYNFEDFGSSLVLLWNLMIVNNWHIIVDAYVRRNSEAVRTYFVEWWFISETIINGVIYGILLEILANSTKRFFSLIKQLKELKSLPARFCLVLSQYFWWGHFSDGYPVLDLSWNMNSALTVDLGDDERKEINDSAIDSVEKNAELSALLKK